MTESIWSKFISVRRIDEKQMRIIVDICGDIINRNPTKDELKGLKSEIHRRQLYKLSEEERIKYLLEFLRYFYEKEGRSPEYRDFINNPKYPGSTTYVRYFGNWNNALKLAGLQINVFINCTDDELLEYLRQFYKENGRILEQLDFSNNPKYPHYAIYRIRFGSWNKAIELAGLQPFNFTNKTDEELLNCLVQFYEENGRYAETSKRCNVRWKRTI